MKEKEWIEEKYDETSNIYSLYNKEQCETEVSPLSTFKIVSSLAGLQYGNCDISEWNGGDANPLPELNGFWLDSSLKISPLEQVQVLNYIFSKENDFDDKKIEVLKEIMYVKELEDAQTEDDISGSKAREIAITLF